MKRFTTALIVIFVASSTIVFAYLLGLRNSQPDDSADNAPGEAQVDDYLIGIVDRGDLVETRRARVAIEAAEELVVSVVGVVTQRFDDDSVEFGSVVLEVEGEPLFLVSGDFDFYRDCEGTCSDGPDIRQLQRILNKFVGSEVVVDGIYGPNTASALELLYTINGYQPPTAPQDVVEAAKELRLSVQQEIGGSSHRSGEQRVLMGVAGAV